MGSIVLVGATMKRANLVGEIGPFRVDTKLDKETQAPAIDNLREEVAKAVADTASRRNVPVEDWAVENGGFHAVQNGDTLDASEPWNEGYGGCVKISAQADKMPLVLDAKGETTSEKAWRLAASKEGSLVNLGLRINAAPKTEDRPAAVFCRLTWIQYAGESTLADRAVEDGVKMEGAPVLDIELPGAAGVEVPKAAPADDADALDEAAKDGIPF